MGLRADRRAIAGLPRRHRGASAGRNLPPLVVQQRERRRCMGDRGADGSGPHARRGGRGAPRAAESELDPAAGMVRRSAGHADRGLLPDRRTLVAASQAASIAAADSGGSLTSSMFAPASLREITRLTPSAPMLTP